MHETLREYCLKSGKEALLEQWHPTKNGILTPDDVSHGSSKKVWWRCSEGHEWQSTPYARTGKGNGCPYCTGKKVSEEMSLEAVYPDVAAQWHPTKNERLMPNSVLPNSHRSVWWKCGKGHEWKALIKSRVEGNGCPVCANKVAVQGTNDLESTHPHLAKEWHPTKNGKLKPSQVVGGSNRKVWWKCEKGHEWQTEIFARTAGNGCPVCTGKTVVAGENDLESNFPEIAKQWDFEKNGTLRPDSVSAYSNKRVWWKCKLGHEWQSAVSSRTAERTGCPYCTGHKVLQGFNDLKTVQPLVAAQWHPTMNEGLEPTMVTAGSRKRVWWRCSDGHEWKAVIYSRAGADKCGCPVCAGKPARKNRRWY
ncbi:MAG: zinc-ribbon domain-containing protein [Oscillospiraceae bacterium]|nr:zinc-ribbon domain-containing protein [Oscillospiraceae bacterium]